MPGTYAPRVPVHPDRHGPTKTQGHNLWLVLHTSEGGETTGSAEALAGLLARPGDRPNGRGGVYGASYHAIFDTDQIIPAVPNDVVAYAAAGGNARGIHGCFPGRAGQTRDQWLDPNSRAMIRQAAHWLVDIATENGIPLARVGPADLVARRAGVCDHHDVSLAFRQSTHTDVGEQFPWDVLWSDIAELLEEDPMSATELTTPRYVALPPKLLQDAINPAWFYVCGPFVRYTTEADDTLAGVPQRRLNDEQYRNLHQSVMGRQP